MENFPLRALAVALLGAVLSACGGRETMPGAERTAQRVEDPRSGADAALDIQPQVREWMSKLSLEQKVMLVSGRGWKPGGLDPSIDRVAGAGGYTVPFPGLDLRSTVLVDGPAGVRIRPVRDGDEATYYATAFPVATLLASSWDVDLLARVGAAMGEEVREYGADVLLAPALNLHRNPLGGRNYEYFSEDPLLSGVMAAAIVDGVQSQGVGATIKHYVANNQETNRFLVDTRVSERALRELYLRGFEITIERSHPWAVMSSYNKVNGVYTSESETLLTSVLRGEWGFDGLVMTDWFAGLDPVAQLKAGNDLLMPGMEERTEIIREALRSGSLSEAELDVNVARILAMVARSPTQQGYAFNNKPDLAAHAVTARQAAAQGAVLLKNDSAVLPLSPKVKNVAVFGNGSYKFVTGGTGSGDVNEAYAVSLVQGLQEAGVQVDAALQAAYDAFRVAEEAKLPQKKYFWESLPPIPEMPLDAAMLQRAAESADLALVTIGRVSGEFHDRKVEGDFELTAAEAAMLRQVSDAFHAAGKRVVVILNIGNVIETASWRGQADAILLPWQGGQEAGNAVADVLTGKTNPSGKLPTSFPLRYADVPSADSFPGIELSDKAMPGRFGLSPGKPSEVEYREGIFVGYRYYDRFDVDTAYPFGYGLSYTQFRIQAGAPVESGSGYRVPVTVTNTGKRAGREVVQLYVSAPAGGLAKPVKELRAFAKSKLLDPGESQTLELAVAARDLASFDPDARAWVAAAGEYVFRVGTSSADIRAQSTVNRAATTRVVTVTADLRPARVVNEISTR